MSLAFLVLLPFLGVLLPPFAARLKASPTVMAISAAVLPALALAMLVPMILRVYGGEVVLQTIPWVPSLGLALAFRLDGLSLLFALLVLGIGLLVILYARYYL